MSDLPYSMGIGPDGKPFAVHATAAPEYGAGALCGLVIGLTLRPHGTFRDGTPPLVAQVAELVGSLMQRGMFDASDVARRYHAWPSAALAEAPLRALPIALFHAGQTEELREAVLAEGLVTQVDWRGRLAAVAVSAAVSAGAFDLVDAHDMAVSAVLQLDELAGIAASDPGGALAHQSVRDDLRRAVAAAHPDDLADGAPDALSNALRRGFWHLVHETGFAPAMHEVAARGEPMASALTGVLVGASLGREAIPEDWQAAIAARVAPLLVLLAADA